MTAIRTFSLCLALAFFSSADLLRAQVGCTGSCGGTSPAPLEEEPPKPEPIPNPQREDGPRFLSPSPGSRQVVLAPSGDPEYILVGSASEISRAESLAGQVGAQVLRRQVLGSLGVSLIVVDLRGKVTLNALRDIFDQNSVAIKADRHATYWQAAGAKVFAGAMVGFDPTVPCPLSRPVRIGLVDGPVDRRSPALTGAPIISRSLLEAEDALGSPAHATGVASLIVSPGLPDFPAGLAVGAEIYSAIAFANDQGQDVARLDSVAAALDWLIGRDVQIVNLSLAGPENEALAGIIDTVASQGGIMVAAAGNEGEPAVAFPAAHAHVIAVTAIDALKRRYPKANFGKALDFAAPGVDILVAEGEKTAYRSGTSYATAIATALVAHAFANGARTFDSTVNDLKSGAEDLGASGRDDRFGWGLIKTAGCAK